MTFETPGTGEGIPNEERPSYEHPEYIQAAVDNPVFAYLLEQVRTADQLRAEAGPDDKYHADAQFHALDDLLRGAAQYAGLDATMPDRPTPDQH